MNKLWLNALTAGLILGAVSLSAGAQAGDHYRDRDDWHGHRDWHEREHGRYCDDWHRGRGEYRRVEWSEYRPVYYRPARYYEEPVYRERVRYDNDIHGSISVGF